MDIQVIINSVDVSDYVERLRIENGGLLRVDNGVLELFGKNSVIGTVASHHNEVSVNITPASSSYNIFHGFVWDIRKQLVRPPDYVKLTLDVRSIGQRLADDTVTVDYWSLQMALNPLADPDKAWTFRKVINDFLVVPDSGFDTGFTVDADTGGNIDNVIDASCTFERQTLLDAIRMICDRIGYDGYIDTDAELNKKVFLRPYDKASTATITVPYVDFEWNSGSLDDVVNYVLVWGGVDEGVPKYDRFTEYGVSKYSPAIWNVEIWYGENGTATIQDVTNLSLGIDEWRDSEGNGVAVNDYCVKAEVTDTTFTNRLVAVLEPSLNDNSGVSTFDCLSRLTRLNFWIMGRVTSYPNYGGISFLRIDLTDTSGNTIIYYYSPKPQISELERDKPYFISVPVGTQENILSYSESIDFNSWKYSSSTTSFDWENVEKVRISATSPFQSSDTGSWWFVIDGLAFVGGREIDPFAKYADELCPPKYDSTSISNYGVHLLHHQDTLLDDFDIANNEGNRVLNNLKNPVPTIQFTIPAWSSLLRPSDVITVQSPIYNDDVRIIGCRYEWNSRNKRIRQTITATNKLNPLPPYWSWEPTLRYLIK